MQAHLQEVEKLAQERVNTDRITRERLRDWAKDLDQFHATPILLVSVGHDEHSGDVHLCITEDTPVEVVISILLWSINELGGTEALVEKVMSMVSEEPPEGTTPGGLIIPR